MLTQQQLAQFCEQGFIVLRGAAGQDACEEIIAFAQSQVMQEAMPIEFEADTQYPGAPDSHDAEGGRTARRLLQVYQRSSLLSEWATGPMVSGVIRQLLGEDALLVQAHHNCIMTKQPRFSSETGWHRDIRYWHYPRPELISVWLALGNERVENGCLFVIPGSHRAAVLPEQLDAALFLRKDHPASQSLLEQAIPVELNQGDVLFFHSNLFHAAGRNQTLLTKYSLVYTYRAVDNPPLPETRSSKLPDVQLELLVVS
ncbi:phytanoyl-CoA dioxygenase family protein [Chitinivorax sp. B]|uniref:phytanoyl-CoA dioxygenase family protein n=1 Tax=Chitinivorax sp. B TaxID=2502235 RepID=UPI0010F73677|nr:phytanoyl-CoA dioxygenase family protein [Chitinivorax sp. B]